MTDFRIIEAEEMPYLYVEKRARMDPAEIGPAMGAALGEVWSFMQAHGVPPAGAALAVYYDYNPELMTLRPGAAT